MESTISLSLLPHPLRSELAVPDRVPSMGQIELFDYLTVLTNDS